MFFLGSREILGWLLVALGVALFLIAYVEFLRQRRVFEAGLLIFPGFIVFRGGIHMLKVAIASRIVSDQHKEPDTVTSIKPARSAPSRGR